MRSELLDTTASLEGQLANWADRMAYNTADLEDALGAAIISQDDLKNLPLFRMAWEQLDASLKNKPFHAVRRIVLGSIQRNLIEAIEVCGTDEKFAVTMNSQTLEALKEMEKFLYERVYRCPQLADTSQKVQEVISKLFYRYQNQPELLPKRYLVRQREISLERTIGDYISGMTDRFCLKVYRQIFGPDDMLLQSIQPVVGIGSL